jgi:hypothetical protein
MNLKQYLSGLTADERKELAERADTSTAYLVQLSGGHRLPSPDMAKKLVAASEEKLTLADLRPDIWSDVA